MPRSSRSCSATASCEPAHRPRARAVSTPAGHTFSPIDQGALQAPLAFVERQVSVTLPYDGLAFYNQSMATRPTSSKRSEFDIIEPIGKRVVVRKDDNK